MWQIYRCAICKYADIYKYTDVQVYRWAMGKYSDINKYIDVQNYRSGKFTDVYL